MPLKTVEWLVSFGGIKKVIDIKPAIHYRGQAEVGTIITKLVYGLLAIV